jgi:PBP1b-binding outer membrane lipoprotein LpoB
MKYLLIILLFASCKTSEQLYTKAKVKDIVKVAELARIDFPCTTTKIDSVTTVDTLYDFIEVDCPPATIDTFETVVVNTVKVKVPRELVTIRTLLKIEDSAKIKVMFAEIQKAAAIIANERKVSATYKMQSEENRNQRNWWRKWCLITWGVIIAGIAFRLFRSKIGL